MSYVALALVLVVLVVIRRRLHRRTLARLEAENLRKTLAWITKRKAANQGITSADLEDDIVSVLNGTGPQGVDDPAFVGTLSDGEAYSIFGSFASAYGFRRPGSGSSFDG